MSNRFLLFLSIITIFVFSSCSNAVKEKQLAKIDSLMAIIDTASCNLNKINIDTVSKRYETYKATNKRVAEHYQKYRNEENWKYLCAYNNVRKPFKTMFLQYGTYKTELISSKKQLEDLKHDVANKLISEEEFHSFFIIESKSANDLSFKINMQVEMVLSQYKNFDTVHPYLIKLIDSYTENQNSKK